MSASVATTTAPRAFAKNAEVEARIVVAAEVDMSTVGEAMIRGALGDTAWRGLPVEVKQVFTANGEAIVAEYQGGVLDVDVRQLHTIVQPTLLVAARDSPAVFEDVTNGAAEALPCARVEWVDGGHLVNPAAPAVLRFIDTLAPTAG